MLVDVASAAVGSFLPADNRIRGSSAQFERPGEIYAEPRDMPWTRLVRVSPGYFETLAAGVLAGRDLSAADRRDAPAVALVNEKFARKEWPGQSPLGQRVDLWMGGEEEAADPGAGWVEVVGVVPDLRFAEFDNGDDLEAVYVPMAQKPQRFAWILARTRGEPEAFARELQAAVTAVSGSRSAACSLRASESCCSRSRLPIR